MAPVKRESCRLYVPVWQDLGDTIVERTRQVAGNRKARHRRMEAGCRTRGDAALGTSPHREAARARPWGRSGGTPGARGTGRGVVHARNVFTSHKEKQFNDVIRD